MYGNTLRHTDRIINSFWKRPQQTGVLLNGEKGSGKTLLAKNISVELAKEGVPTIVINRDWTGDGFFKLLQDIDQPCVVLFDEFEKVYDREKQEEILTLLDA
jgi:SpoVK/Ycf46/Vps4 family AAA+-type ATPase